MRAIWIITVVRLDGTRLASYKGQMGHAPQRDFRGRRQARQGPDHRCRRTIHAKETGRLFGHVASHGA